MTPRAASARRLRRQEVPNDQTNVEGLYERELMALQAKLVDMQAWVQQSGARVVVIFEGRDAAGKGSTINRARRPDGRV